MLKGTRVKITTAGEKNPSHKLRKWAESGRYGYVEKTTRHGIQVCFYQDDREPLRGFEMRTFPARNVERYA